MQVLPPSMADTSKPQKRQKQKSWESENLNPRTFIGVLTGGCPRGGGVPGEL